MDFLISLSRDWLVPNLREISLALMATVLFLYGNDINKWVKTHIKVKAFLLRVLLFVAICSFGFAGIAILGARIVHYLFDQFSLQTLPIAIFLCFFGVGVLAERKNQM